MASSNSTSTTSTLEDGLGDGEGSRKRKSRAALFSDDCRLKIIEEIYNQKFLWNTDSRDSNNVSPGVRKKAFGEIAVKISTQNNSLKAEDVERQWKNLKDTYVKIRKKLPPSNTQSSDSTSKPRWRFYRILQFIDPDEKVSRDFNFLHELAIMHNEQRKQDTPTTSSRTSISTPNNSTSSPIVLTTFINTNNSSTLTPTSNGISSSTSTSSNGLKQNGGLHPNALNFRTTPHQLISVQTNANNRLKRPADTQITYVRHNTATSSKQPKIISSNGIEGPVEVQTMKMEEANNVPPANGVQMNGLNSDDEYGIFCNSLQHPLREIGIQDKLEYLNLKKFIHDKLYEVQARLHTRMNGDRRI